MRAFFLAYREILQITSGELVPVTGSAKVQTTSGLFTTQDGMAACDQGSGKRAATKHNFRENVMAIRQSGKSDAL